MKLPDDLNQNLLRTSVFNPPSTPTKKKPILNLENFKDLKSEGSFYRIYSSKGNTIFRVAKKPTSSLTEVEILKNLRHKFINQMISYSVSNGFLIFEMEYADMNLRQAMACDCLGGYSASDFSVADAPDGACELCAIPAGASALPPWGIYMMHNISAALAFVHHSHIIHMDIKPENILVKFFDKKKVLFQLCDFNISKFGEGSIDLDGDKLYMPPEILLNISSYKSDVFSLGLVYFEILNDKLPTTGHEYNRIRSNDFAGYKMDTICERMLETKYKDRICSNTLCKYFLHQI